MIWVQSGLNANWHKNILVLSNENYFVIKRCKLFQVSVEDDFTSSGPGSNSTTTSHNPNFDMNNPQQASFVPGHQPGSFYGHAPGQPANFSYQGPMSPYPGSPMSPYGNNQNQGPPNGASPGSGLYSNQNSSGPPGSQLYNQNQSSSGQYPGYQPGGFPGQSYYGNSNQSPTHGQYPGYGQQPGQPVRQLSPPPAGMQPGMLQLGARIPHPNINSPNQNSMKTEAPVDLKPGQYGPAQGYTGSGPGYGYNGYGTARPLVSPMSPHQGRLNISPGGPNLSPRDGPPNMSPHPSLYSHQPSSSPGPAPVAYHGSYQAQYSEYFKQQQAGHSPGQAAVQQGYQGPDADKLSDGQSNAGSVRSAEAETDNGAIGDQAGSDTSLTNLTNVKKENSEERPNDNDKLSSDSDCDNKFTPKSESEEAVKTEAGSYFEQHKDFTLKANQTLIDGIDSIPELPEIPELKYEDVSEMNRLQEDKDHKATPPSLSPDNLKDGASLGRGSWDEGGEEEGFHDNMAGGWPGPHMQGKTFSYLYSDT